MNYLENFNNVNLLNEVLAKIIAFPQEIKIMEVCGTHTRAFLKSGLMDLLPDNINLISGPGCPICVSSPTYIDTAIDLASREGVILVTLADLLRVPGKTSSLQQMKTRGSDIRVVNSPLEAVKIAEDNINFEIVFLGIGFETTAPIIALSVLKAKELNLSNFSLLLSIKTMPLIIEELLLDKELEIDGFICPGHVSAIIGSQAFSFIGEKYRIPAVIAGFERVDIILALVRILEMLESEQIQVKNIYKRVVKNHGNQRARGIINQIFKTVNSSWRGIGEIKESGLGLKERYIGFDAFSKFNLVNRFNYRRIDRDTKTNNYSKKDELIPGCSCGDIIKGKKIPLDCKLFNRSCTPLSPKGPCMVSEEGNCNIFYQYRGRGERDG